MILAAILLCVTALAGISLLYFDDRAYLTPDVPMTPKQQLEHLLNAIYGEGSVKDLRIALIDDEMSFQGIIIKRRDDDSISNHISKCINN